MFDVFPLIPITVLPGPSTKYGPDKEPVGLGVTLSYNWPISLPDLQEDLLSDRRLMARTKAIIFHLIILLKFSNIAIFKSLLLFTTKTFSDFPKQKIYSLLRHNKL